MVDVLQFPLKRRTITQAWFMILARSMVIAVALSLSIDYI